jgi:Ca2+-binding EF-hand superfamily protein
LLDSNHDGWISRSEAESVPDLVKDFDQYDLNRDGKLDRSEFDRYAK